MPHLPQVEQAAAMARFVERAAAAADPLQESLRAARLGAAELLREAAAAAAERAA